MSDSFPSVDAFDLEPPGESLAQSLKTPPHNLEAEQSVLGGVMLAGEQAWFNVSEVVSATDFYRTQHQIIFEAMNSVAADNAEVDAVTVAEKLQASGKLEKAGGIAYLGQLTEITPGASNVVAWARIVRDQSLLRQLIDAGNAIVESVYSRDGRSSRDLVDQAEKLVFDVSEGRVTEGGPQPLNPLLVKAMERVESLVGKEGHVTGLETGFADLDERTAGLQNGDLIIVAGRPSMGKTSLAMNMAEHAVMQSEATTLVFSMEMPAEQLVIRLLSSLGRIDQSRMRTGNLEPDEFSRLAGAVSQLRDRPLIIDDTPALTPNEVRTRARRVARENNEHGLGLIVVDYLQLMRASGTPENRTNEISEVSRSLKAIAKEIGCPLVALSQLNRGLENRTDKRPVMADLRESGAIEQDADVIFFIYRDEVYNDASPDKGIAEIIIGKQRNGPTGVVRLAFLKEITRFENQTTAYH
ncbi:MAG TPA: replicative DNA helicase [Acidobacteria bacterium]|nr:replicative DNA helicase [Acidobacteriota bacterium]